MSGLALPVVSHRWLCSFARLFRGDKRPVNAEYLRSICVILNTADYSLTTTNQVRTLDIMSVWLFFSNCINLPVQFLSFLSNSWRRDYGPILIRSLWTKLAWKLKGRRSSSKTSWIHHGDLFVLDWIYPLTKERSLHWFQHHFGLYQSACAGSRQWLWICSRRYVQAAMGDDRICWWPIRIRFHDPWYPADVCWSHPGVDYEQTIF